MLFDSLLWLLFILLPKIGSFQDLSVLPLLVLLGRSLKKSADGSPLLVPKYVTLSLALLAICLLYSLLLFLFTPLADLQYILKFTRFLLLFITLVVYLSTSTSGPRTLIRVILWSATANLLLILCQYAIFSLGLTDYSHLIYNPSFDLTVQQPFRQPGITSGYPNSSFLMIFAFVVSTFAVRLGFSIRLPPLLCLLLLLFSFLSSRSGIVLGLISLLFLFPPHTPKIRLPSASFANVTRLALLLLFLLLIPKISSLPNLMITDNISFFTEPLQVLLSADVSKSESLAALFNSYTSFISDRDFLFGNSLWMTSSTGANYDNGFLILLASQGIFVFTTVMIIYLNLVRLVRPNLLAIYFLLFFVIVNLKVDIIAVRQLGDCFLMALLAFIYSRKTKHSAAPLHLV